MTRSMQSVFAIVKKELKHYFYSPIAYVVMMLFLTLSGYFFYSGVVRFSEQYKYLKGMMQVYQNPEILKRLNLNEMVIAPALFNMIFIFLFMLPLIMMRSFAEERSKKTDELLRTSPITGGELLAGKFLGAFGFVCVLLLPTVVYQVLLFTLLSSPPELGPVLTGYLGVILFSAAGIAVGLFASALTENQIIGAVITFVVLLFMFIINFIQLSEGTFTYSIVKYISVGEHIQNMLRGLLDTRDVLYFVSIMVVFLTLTKRTLEGQGWR